MFGTILARHPGASTFLALLCMIGFFAASWAGAKIARFVGLPALIFEIGVGIVLGPQVGNLIGHEYATCTSRHFTACKVLALVLQSPRRRGAVL